MKTLQHNQEIRVKGFSPYAQRITVRTVRGCRPEAAEEAHAAALAKGHATTWASQAPAVLTADYDGKAAELDAAAVARAAAPLIADGDAVEIEGELFRVRVIGEQYSDPVKFVKA
jgi:hypothetical protein